MKMIALSAMLALSFVSASALAAPKKGTNADAAKASANTPATQAVDGLRTADALARYGDAKKDPLALIAAAKMKKEIGATETTFTRKSGKAGDAKAKTDTMTVEAILERAKALAAGRADLIGLADDVAKAGSRGAVGGPKSGRTVVRGGSADQFRLMFEGGEPAAIAISGDGDSRLDLYVIDENGNQVCGMIGPGDDAICRFTPKWTGPFTVRVVNRGMANEYRIRTN